jgi:hypothetical protein
MALIWAFPPTRLTALGYVYPDGDTVKAHFNPDDGLLRMTSRNIQTSIGPSPVQVWFEDYRDVEGVQLSHRYVTLFPGERHVTRIDDVRLNEPIDDSVFELPPRPDLTALQKSAVTGEYNFGDTLSVTIGIEDGDLYFDDSSAETFPLLAINDTLFLIGSGHAMRNLEFGRSSDGRLSTLTISKGEVGVTGTRIVQD